MHWYPDHYEQDLAQGPSISLVVGTIEDLSVSPDPGPVPALRDSQSCWRDTGKQEMSAPCVSSPKRSIGEQLVTSRPDREQGLAACSGKDEKEFSEE